MGEEVSGRWARAGHVKLEEQVRALISSGETFTNHDLMQRFGASQQTGWNVIADLKKKGVIVQIGLVPRDSHVGRPRILYGAPGAPKPTTDKGAALASVWR